MIFNSILPLVLDSKQALKATIEHSFQNCNSSTHLEFKYLKSLLCASLKMCRIYTPPLQTHYWAETTTWSRLSVVGLMKS